MIHYCYEGMPTLMQILAERNPPLNAVILEGLQIEKEMREMRSSQGPLVLFADAVERR